jgi:hypothetical protein
LTAAAEGIASLCLSVFSCSFASPDPVNSLEFVVIRTIYDRIGQEQSGAAPFVHEVSALSILVFPMSKTVICFAQKLIIADDGQLVRIYIAYLVAGAARRMSYRG